MQRRLRIEVLETSFWGIVGLRCRSWQCEQSATLKLSLCHKYLELPCAGKSKRTRPLQVINYIESGSGRVVYNKIFRGITCCRINYPHCHVTAPRKSEAVTSCSRLLGLESFESRAELSIEVLAFYILREIFSLGIFIIVAVFPTKMPYSLKGKVVLVTGGSR